MKKTFNEKSVFLVALIVWFASCPHVKIPSLASAPPDLIADRSLPKGLSTNCIINKYVNLWN